MKKLLVAFFAFTTSFAFAQFPVGNTTITYNDPARNNRAIECRIYYPGVSAGTNVAVATGEFPIIVFGHGFTMQPTAYPNWSDEFVPEGYIIVLPATETSFSPSHQEFGSAACEGLLRSWQYSSQETGLGILSGYSRSYLQLSYTGEWKYHPSHHQRG